MARFRLITLGDLIVTAPDIALPSGVQRRRSLALLAILAASGDAGITLERVMTLLWPEFDLERAQNNLKQTKHGIRAAMGTDALVRQRARLKLNKDVVAVDLWDYQGLVAAGKLEQAVAVYTGPFLDGFNLPRVVGFQRWVESERERIEQFHVRTIETLARKADQPEVAVEWWTQLAAIDPLSDKYAEGLIRALHRAGDTATALRAARRHEERLRTELEVEPSASLRGLVDEIRQPQRAPVTAPSPFRPRQPTRYLHRVRMLPEKPR